MNPSDIRLLGKITGAAILVAALFLFLGCAADLQYTQMSYDDQKNYDDIQYIASKQERKEFLGLHPTQRQAFLDEFWKRRDPTPDTTVNEFKIEHYRRIAYANKYYGTSAYPGWKTDRGWSYIKFGPPDQIDRKPAGDINPSGGWLSNPYEVWSYDSAPGLRINTQFTFVDKYFTGVYERVSGLTGVSNDPKSSAVADMNPNKTKRADRGGDSADSDLSNSNQISTSRSGSSYDYMHERFKAEEQKKFIDQVEEETAGKMTVSKEIPIFVQSSKFLADSGHLFVQFDYQIPYTDLKFLDMPDGKFRATLYVGTELQRDNTSYMVGQVQKDINLDNKEDTVNPNSYFKYSTGGIVQPGEYILRVSLRDPLSGRVAYHSEMVSVNPVGNNFGISSCELATEIAKIPQDAADSFRKYDWRVVPNPMGIYSAGSNLGIYYEIYNLTLNQDKRHEYFVDYLIYPKDKRANTLIHEKFRNIGPEGAIHTIQAYTPKLENDKFPPGNYVIEINITDIIAKTESMQIKEFKVVG
jgi:GWxTD domain-containing protein